MSNQSYLEITMIFVTIYVAIAFIVYLALTIKNKTVKKKVEALREMVTQNLQDGSIVPTKETDAGKLWTIIASNRCPDCGNAAGGVFFEGPSGGLSTNIECANKACGAKFNVTPLIGIAERI